jgi:hypothetical protein
MAINQQLTDATIIKMVLHGDVDKFEILIRRYSGMLYNIARSYGFSHPDAEKLTANVFLNAYQKLGRIRQRKPFKKLLFDIMLKEYPRGNNKNIPLNHMLAVTLYAELISQALAIY